MTQGTSYKYCRVLALLPLRLFAPEREGRPFVPVRGTVPGLDHEVSASRNLDEARDANGFCTSLYRQLKISVGQSVSEMTEINRDFSTVAKARANDAGRDAGSYQRHIKIILVGFL